MKRGLVIGKFMPVHNGHIALINFAASQCDELIVSMSFAEQDPINADQRFLWLKETFKDSAEIKVHKIKDDFDNESLALTERTAQWAEVMKRVYPKIDVIISSEEYGKPFAINLGAEHVSFDPDRKKIPVSATLIRNNPHQYWNYIPDIVKPSFVKIICFYGPESTGKSTMSKKMAQLYNTAFVPEVARELITSNDFTVDDIIRIGHAQTNRVLEKLKTANKFLFCDTDVITTQVYSRLYLNIVPPVLFELEKQIRYDHYFLFDINTTWVADGLRDLGERRQEMLQVFKHELEIRNIHFTMLTGSWEEKEAEVQKIVSN